MKKIKVKVFDAYKVPYNSTLHNLKIGYKDIYDFHNHIIDVNGFVWDEDDGFEVPERFTNEVEKYELEPKEKANLHTKASLIEMYKQNLEEAEQEYHKYLKEILKDLDLPEGAFMSEWDCQLSPIGNCICCWDGSDDTCIFCGEPDERK